VKKKKKKLAHSEDSILTNESFITFKLLNAALA